MLSIAFSVDFSPHGNYNRRWQRGYMKALDLGNKNVFSTVVKLAVPAMAAQFINVLYSVVDRMFVGNIETIGDTALAGVGVCAPVATLISSFAFWVGLGGAPMFAMALGRKREDESRKILSNALLALVALAVFVSAATTVFIRPLLMTFGASENTYVYAREYLLIYAAGAIFSITAVGLNQFIIAQGYAGVGMMTTIIGAVANVALDPLFIFAFRMNVAGAALATVLSQFLSFLFVIVFLRKKNTKVRLTAGGYSIKTIVKTLKMGISPFLIMATDSAIIIVFNAVLQRYGGASGDMWITASTVVVAFSSLVLNPLMGISTGTQPVLSYNYGAKNIPLIKRAEKCILGMCLAFTALMFALSFAGAAPFAKLFTSNPQIVENSVWGIRIYMIGVIPLSFQYAFVDGFTGLGQPQYAIVLSMLRKMVFYLVSLLVLPAFLGVEAAFYAQPIADVAGSLASTVAFAVFFPKVLRKRQNATIG